MATLRTIRLRIKGTKNIKQITRAMEAVSAVKMRKSQGVALAARPYAIAALKLLKKLRQNLPKDKDELTPFLEQRPVKNSLLIVVTSDKGLAGPFNTNVLKKAENFRKNAAVPVQLITVGKKGTEYFSRRGRTPIASYTDFGDYADLEEVTPIFDALDPFLFEKVDEVHIIYTNFLSALKQEVIVRKLLPFTEEGLEETVRGIVPDRGKFSEQAEAETAGNTEYMLEPSAREIFNQLLPELLKIQIYHAVLEANASEHSSRMIAMRNATDNAGELIKTYTVSLNKARQAAINKELAEISGGSEALAA